MAAEHAKFKTLISQLESNPKKYQHTPMTLQQWQSIND